MTSSELVDGLNPLKKDNQPLGLCAGCTYGKLHRLLFPEDGYQRANEVEELLRSNLCSFMQHPSPKDVLYYIIFVTIAVAYALYIF